MFDLLCNNEYLIKQKPISLVKAMENVYKKQEQYKGCIFTIKYNSTI